MPAAPGQYQVVYAVHDFKAEDEDEVSFKTGEEIVVLERDDEFGDGWWMGRTQDGQIGLFPANFTSPTPVSPTTSESTASAPRAETQNDADDDVRAAAPASAPAPAPAAAMPEPPTPTKHPAHRESVMGPPPPPMASTDLDSADDDPYEALMQDLRKSIDMSTSKLEELRRASDQHDAPPLPDIPAHLQAMATSYTSRPPLTWTVAEVAAWVADAGFAPLAPNFARNEINGEAMLSLTLPTLKELQIPALGKRIQIMNAIVALKEEWGLADENGPGSTLGRGRRPSASPAATPPPPGLPPASSVVGPPPTHLSVSPVRRPSASAASSLNRTRSPSLGRGSVSQRSSGSTASGPTPVHLVPPVPPVPAAAEPVVIRATTPTAAPAMSRQNMWLPNTDLPAMALKDPDMAGVLKTLENTTGYGGAEGEWKRRWMVLHDGVLYWYKDKAAAHALHAIAIHSGFKIMPDATIKSGRYGIRVTEMNPDAGPRKVYLFYTDDGGAARNWQRALTKTTIFHSQHEAAKHGHDGVEIIGDPRDVIRAIRINDDDMNQSELGMINQEWMGRDPYAHVPPAHPLGTRSLPRSASGTSMRDPNAGPPPNPGRRPSLPHNAFSTRSAPSAAPSTAPATLPLVPPPPPEKDFPASHPVFAPRSYSMDRRPSGGMPAHVRRPSGGMPANLRQPGPPVGPSPDRIHAALTFVNAHLPPSEQCTAFRDLVSGVSFLHMLANWSATALPPHYARAVRDPARYRIDWLDNWDVALGWASELGVIVPVSVVPEKLASGREEVFVELVNAVQRTPAYE
ncbi:polar growth protein [Allomyces javanicus]|nr:polar growth protein [Allomyces javanicus]